MPAPSVDMPMLVHSLVVPLPAIETYDRTTNAVLIGRLRDKSYPVGWHYCLPKKPFGRDIVTETKPSILTLGVGVYAASHGCFPLAVWKWVRLRVIYVLTNEREVVNVGVKSSAWIVDFCGCLFRDGYRHSSGAPWAGRR